MGAFSGNATARPPTNQLVGGTYTDNAGTALSGAAAIFFSPFGGNNWATEAIASMRVPFACTINKLQWHESNGHASSTFTCTLYKNGIATSLVATAANTAANVVATDDANSVSVAAGDTISISIIRTAGSQSITYPVWAFQVTPT